MYSPTHSIRFGIKSVTVSFALGALFALTTACGAEADGMEWDAADSEFVEEVDQLSEAITGGWTNVTLVNGWQNYNTTDPPAIGIVDGVVRFRGAMKGPNATSTAAFLLPAAFRPYFTSGGQTHVGADIINMRTVLSGSAGGGLFYEPDLFGGQSPTHDMIHVRQDGVTGVGSAAKVLTSLDGVTFDRTDDNATTVYVNSGWSNVYGMRLRTDGSITVKLVDGFVRFQGALTGASNASMHLFTLPSQFRPGQTVYVPVQLCNPGQNGKYGRLNIYSSGEVHVQGNTTAARCLVSLEGASYSLTGGGTALTLLNGWEPYSPRAVKARLEDEMVRFEGAVKNGTTNLIAQLPQNMRPARTVYLASDSWGAAQGRIYVTSSGNVHVQYPTLSTAKGFTSLDGLSFGL